MSAQGKGISIVGLMGVGDSEEVNLAGGLTFAGEFLAEHMGLLRKEIE